MMRSVATNPDPEREARRCGLFAADNAPRFPNAGKSGHVESYFLRANHPGRPLALWLKATVLVPNKGAPVAEVWCARFDGERQVTWAARDTVPLSEARFAGDPLQIKVGGCRFELGPDGGSSQGELSNQAGTCQWDLEWVPTAGPLSDPSWVYPNRKWIERPLPRSKLLTPAPILRFGGTVAQGGSTDHVEDWLGMQGHNWGSEHAFKYAWGQCIFTGADDEPVALVEGTSARLRIARMVTPHLSAMVVRRHDRVYSFGQVVDLWNQRVQRRDLAWVLSMSSPDGEVMLAMESKPEMVACLGYRNPSGVLSHCLNSKLARVVLRVNPANDEPFECSSENGGALEFLSCDADSRFPVQA